MPSPSRTQMVTACVYAFGSEEPCMWLGVVVVVLGSAWLFIAVTCSCVLLMSITSHEQGTTKQATVFQKARLQELINVKEKSEIHCRISTLVSAATGALVVSTNLLQCQYAFDS